MSRSWDGAPTNVISALLNAGLRETLFLLSSVTQIVSPHQMQNPL
jgi:hypothetical protein